jgi:hypothetical protein
LFDIALKGIAMTKRSEVKEKHPEREKKSQDRILNCQSNSIEFERDFVRERKRANVSITKKSGEQVCT